MEAVFSILSGALIVTGAVFCIIGALGVVRLPDVFTRMHGAGIIDTLGLMLVMAGFVILAGLTLISVKLVLIVAFVLFTSPIATHALSRACLNGGIKPVTNTKSSIKPVQRTDP